MENTLETTRKSARDIHYYRQRFKNRVFERLVEFFAAEAERRGLTKRHIAMSIDRDPAQVTRWLSYPSNFTLETISDLLLAMDAEPEPFAISLFENQRTPNYAHPLLARALGVEGTHNASKRGASTATFDGVCDGVAGSQVVELVPVPVAG